MATQSTIDIVDKNIGNMFSDIVKEYDLDSGDISPEQVAELETIKSGLAELLSDFVFDNLVEESE